MWDEGHENDFFRRMPSALSLALEATDLESLARATAKGAEVLWDCAAEVVLPSDGELRRKIQATALNDRRRPAGFRHNSRAAALRMPLIATSMPASASSSSGASGRSDARSAATSSTTASCARSPSTRASCASSSTAAAVTDPLTGVANRRRLMDELEHRTGAPYRLLMLDADGLKQVNDSLGYEDGDLLIVALADTLASVLEAGRAGCPTRRRRARRRPERALARRRVGPRAPPARARRRPAASPSHPRHLPGERASAASPRDPAETPRETLRRAGAEMQRHKRRRKSDRG